MKNLNPQNYLVFKKLFGNEKNNDILKSFVNSTLSEDEQIVSLELINPYKISDNRNGLIPYFEMEGEDAKKRRYLIDIQMLPFDILYPRLNVYLSRQLNSNLLRGLAQVSIHKSLLIHIVIFDRLYEIFKNETLYQYSLGMEDRNDENITKVCQKAKLQLLDLRNFKVEISDVKSPIERWITFLNNAENYTKDNLPEQLASDKEIVKAVEELQLLTLNETEQLYYDNQQKEYLERLKQENTTNSN